MCVCVRVCVCARALGCKCLFWRLWPLGDITGLPYIYERENVNYTRIMCKHYQRNIFRIIILSFTKINVCTKTRGLIECMPTFFARAESLERVLFAMSVYVCIACFLFYSF